MGKYAAVVSLLAMVLGRAADAPGPVFRDVTEESKIRFEHCLGDDEINTIVEATGSGCAFLDYDGDGWIDIYAVNGRYLEGVNDPESTFKGAKLGNHLYRNKGDGTFEDVTAKAGVADGGYGMGVSVGDYDNDGRPDFYVTNYSGNTLYHNNGDGTFTDVTAKAGVRGNGSWSVGAVFFDYDKDGKLDLFVGNYLEFDPKYRLYYEADVYPGPLSYPPLQSILYHNNGDGTFTDVTAKAGVTKKGRAMGALSADYDDDGWPDLFVANDAMQNYLYHNNGNGTFTEVGLESGVAFGQHGNAVASMGGDFGDFDRDGKLDLMVPAMSYITFYRNLGKGLFEDVSVTLGIAKTSAQFWSWGGDFVDYDNNGELDLLIVNGDGHRLSEKQEQLLMKNEIGPDGKRMFVDVSRSAGEFFDSRMVARGLATGDYDNDGDTDFFVLNIDQPSKLLRNDGGNKNNWIRVQLTGTKSNRDGVGAKVTVRSGEWALTEERMSSSSYLSQNDPRMLFGLGQHAKVDEVTVRWPSGKVQQIKAPAINQLLKVVEQ
jgi:enediyne biosynthesis protein E4